MTTQPDDLSWFTPPEPEVHLKGDEKGRSYTPDACALAVLRVIAEFITPKTMWEPCVGGGAWVRAARIIWPNVWVAGTDLDPEAPGLKLCDDRAVYDARHIRRLCWPLVDLSVTNPPFGKAVGQEVTVSIVVAARRAATVCAMLVPLDYLTQAGFEAHIDECAMVAPLLPRPFPHERGMALLLWDTRHEGPTIHRKIRWKAVA